MLATRGCLHKLNSQFMCWCVLENQLKDREKSVKSQGILFELTAGNPVYSLHVLKRDIKMN